MSREMKAGFSMNEQLPTAEIGSAAARRGFGAALLIALHESRRRQAARAIHEHRHLIDEVKACEFWRAIERSRANSSRDKALATSGVSRMVLLVTRTRAWAPVARLLVPQGATAQIEERLGEGKSS